MRTLRKQQPVLGDYDTALYVSERLHADAADGTLIPISVVYRHDTPRDGSAPLLLYGYGSYGLSMPVVFSSNRLSLLDRGMIFAIAHIRGGGELGKPWHDAGRMHRKLNTFTDFIACAEDLIAEALHFAQNRLVIEGGSAGGLLMGAISNLAPIFSTPCLPRPLRRCPQHHARRFAPAHRRRVRRVGQSHREEDYFYIKPTAPTPTSNAKTIPAMLVKTGLNDSQVMYWEPPNTWPNSAP